MSRILFGLAAVLLLIGIGWFIFRTVSRFSRLPITSRSTPFPTLNPMVTPTPEVRPNPVSSPNSLPRSGVLPATGL